LRIVFLLVDALRKDHLACYGNTWLNCPNLARIAARSTVFTHTQVSRPDCRAVRLELMTGMSSARFAHPISDVRALAAGSTLPAVLKQAGHLTGLVTDHRDAMWLYRMLCDFDFVLYVPGQADDPQIRSPDDLTSPWQMRYEPVVPEFAPDSDRLRRYVRNQGAAEGPGYATEKLFTVAAETLTKLADVENVFLLIDSFGILPPWNPPEYFAAYRGENASQKLAWLSEPLVGGDKITEQQLKFLRCAYADSCLFYDHALTPLTDVLADQGDIHVLLASDHGMLIGDDGYVGCDATVNSPAAVDQVLLAAKPGGGSDTCDQPICPADIYASTLALAAGDPPVPSDGRRIGAIAD